MIMKKFINIKAIKIVLTAFILFAAGITNAQIGIGITKPAASAQLDVVSTTKGFLPPRMTQTQRDAIKDPAAGLMIWCNNCGASGEIQVYNGSRWTNMAGGTARDSVVIIGSQVWMPRNLDVVTYRNGDIIPEVTDPAVWGSKTSGAWCYYNFNLANTAYGKLYNRYAIMDPRGLAPAGWRIPERSEWIKLSNALGGGAVAANKMRATTLWSSPVNTETNQSGFSALPAGQCDAGGAFSSIGTMATWWIPGQNNVYYPHDDITFYFSANLSESNFDIVDMEASVTTCDPNTDPLECFTNTSNVERSGFSVRCVKEEPSVTIGTQVWMNKNLDVAKYRNGDPIPQVTDPVQWANLTTGAWCYYNNDPALGAVYGKLYNRAAIMDARGLAPLGWHVSNTNDWHTLTDYLGWAMAANKLRAPTLWNSPVDGETNQSGFTGLPGGKRNLNGTFSSIGESGDFWNTDEFYEYLIHGSYTLYYYKAMLEANYVSPEIPLQSVEFQNNSYYGDEYENVWIYYYGERAGYSVRCVRD
jgi:uncharacterized protein (TIGR02145 family)